MRARLNFLLFLLPLSLVGNASVSADPTSRWQHMQWKAHWVGPAHASGYDYGVHLFRKSFHLDSKPDRFLIHVSADQRYVLWVNGTQVARGPAAGGVLSWNYETLDIAPFLTDGANLIAASVVNYGRWTPGAQPSVSTALIIQGHAEPEQIVNTDGTWKTTLNGAYRPSLVAMGAIDIEPADVISGSAYPWGWETRGYEDDAWHSVAVYEPGQPKGTGTQYVRALQPRQIPMPELEDEPPMRVVRSEGAAMDGFFQPGPELEIRPNSTIRLLLDQGYLTNAFVELTLSGGKGATVGMAYAEALYLPDGTKGNRNEIDGKELVGVKDVIHPDGHEQRTYRPLNFKTFRYIELEVQTGDDPLVIDGFRRTFVGYPFEERASFESDNPTLHQIWDIGWRTARLCAVDLYYDCPYYERLQYTGDTRIQSLISLYVTGDDRLMRKAIADLASSMTAEGILQSRYPTRHTQIIPPFSLYWINMLHDYWMHRPDPAFVKSHIPTVKRIVEWYSAHIDQQTGMLGFAKGKLQSALKIAASIVEALPKNRLSPETTAKREGFVHPVSINGGVEQATIEFIVRDFDDDNLHSHERELEDIVKAVLSRHPGCSYRFDVTEQYRNMKQVLDRYPQIMEVGLEGIRRAGMEPIRRSIRGGTDGSRLSFMGLPCPNIFAGGHAFHGKEEWVSVQDMEKAVRTILHIAALWEERGEPCR